jgi:hypothetical protein
MRNLLSILTVSALLLALPAMAAGDGSRLRERLQGGGGEGGGKMQMMMQKHQEHMKQMDTDGDGAVSKAEFLAGAEARFAKMDKNGDGKLDSSDRPQRGGPGGPVDGGPVVPDVQVE